MITHHAREHSLRLQTFVFANGQLYKSGTQRIADSLGGLRAEPALSGLAVQVWTAQITDEAVVFGRPTSAVFDEQGLVRSDVRHWAILGVLDGLGEAGYVQQQLSKDEQVQSFLDIVTQGVDPQLLSKLAPSAKALPTK